MLICVVVISVPVVADTVGPELVWICWSRVWHACSLCNDRLLQYLLLLCLMKNMVVLQI